MNVVVTACEQPFFLDRPFRWREPLQSAPMAADQFGTMLFSTESTVGFAGGDTNLYRRVGNSPINATDPSGNAANLVAGGVGAGVGAIFGAGAYLYQYATGGVEKFSGWDMGAYALGGAAAGGVAGLTFGASLAAVGGLGGTVASTAIAGGVTGIAAGATGGLVTGVGSTVDDAWRGDANWSQVGMAGLHGMGRGAFYGGIAGFSGGAAFPIAASLTGGGIAGGFIAGSTSAMFGDFSSQLAGIAVGLQSHFDAGQTALAGIGGGLLGGRAGYRDAKLGGLPVSGAWREPIAWGRNLLGIGKWRGTFSDLAARQWYLKQETQIPDRIDRSSPLKQQAEQAHALRNQIRTQSRNMMANRAKAEDLFQTDPNLPFEYFVEKYSAPGKSMSRVYQDIIDGAQRSRASVNQRLSIGSDFSRYFFALNSHLVGFAHRDR